MFDKNGIDRIGLKRTNGIAEVFLDTRNINEQLDYARSVCKEHGDNKVPSFDITGRQYLEGIEKMVDIAYKIVTGNLLPDLFDALPLRKDGSFKALANGQTIPVYDPALPNVQNWEPFPWNTKQILAIVTHDNYRTEQLHPADTQHAAIVIIDQKWIGAKRPLLDADLRIQDIKTPATYLKAQDIHPGRIYIDKDGREYLSLGSHSVGCTTQYCCVRWTRKVQKMASDCKDLSSLARKLNEKNVRISIRYSTPRKFTQEIGTAFPEPVGDCW